MSENVRGPDLKQFTKWMERLEKKIEKTDAGLLRTTTPQSLAVPSTSLASTITDLAAIHLNAANELNDVEEKTALVDDDLFILEDSENGFVKLFAKLITLLSANHDYVKFDTAATPTLLEGMIGWNAEHKVIEVKSDGTATMQVGLELWDRGHNSTGDIIIDGSVVYPQGIVNGLGDARLAKADSPLTARWPLAIATVDLPIGGDGQVTVFGDVNGIDTSGLSLGPVYLSATVAGAMTSTPPTHPNIRYLLGFCKVVDANDGVVFVMPRDMDILSFFNGTFRETFDFLVTSDGLDIIGTLTRGDANAGDLNMRFSTGISVLDTTTTPLTIAVTAGTLNSPQDNYFYVPLSTLVLTKSLVGWPTEQHIRVSFVRVADAGHTQTYGAMTNQNWNDHDAAIDTGQGHGSHTGQWVRRRQASFESGIDPNGLTSSYFTLGVGNTDFISTVGEVWQMHPQVVNIINMTTGSGAIVTNWFGDKNHVVADLFEIVNDSDGDGFGNNKYFNVFFFSIATKSSENNMLYVNLPSGQYTNENLAVNDSSGFDNNVIPDSYTKDSATGFPICRATFRMGATWELIDLVDLRTDFPAGISGGGGVVSPLTTFSDADFRIFDNADIAKILAFELSGLSTSRTITIPDNDVTLLTTAEKNALHALYVLTQAKVEAVVGVHFSAGDAVTAMGAKADANPLNHDRAAGGVTDHPSLTDKNTEANVKHLTDAQVAALHTEVTRASLGLDTTDDVIFADMKRQDSYSNATEETARDDIANYPFVVESDYVEDDWYPLIALSSDNDNATKAKVGIYTQLKSGGASLYFAVSNIYANGLTKWGMHIDRDGNFHLMNDSNWVRDILDEDDMASDDQFSLVTQQSVRAYVNNETYYRWIYLNPRIGSNVNVIGADTYLITGQWSQTFANAVNNAFYYGPATIEIPVGYSAEIKEFISYANNPHTSFFIDKVKLDVTYWNGSARVGQSIIAEVTNPFGTTTGLKEYHNNSPTSFVFTQKDDLISAAERTLMEITTRYQINKVGGSGTIAIYSHAVKVEFVKL